MSTQNRIRVRFAPSPTGFLHVGGARTALFNWLYARGQGGSFILRIEDTDQQRSTEESYAAILRGMQWLGLDWDEGPQQGGDYGPYLQSQRLEIYQKHLAELIAGDKVYKCFCTSEDLAQREQAVSDSGGNWDGYDGHCRQLSDDQQEAFAKQERAFCWRLRTPDADTTFWYDIIVGKREFQNEVLVDRVVGKADGFPTYNFAVVIDDHEMGITHVLRGDDHVSNTPFQLLIYDALGWDRPKFGHMPMILGPDRKRLSKRHGATSVEEFQKLGVLPAAMVNYLALLGWSPGGSGDEVLEQQTLVKKFSLKKVNSSPAAFDYDKLGHLNSQHIKRLSPEQRIALAEPILAERSWRLDPQWRIAGAEDDRTYLDRVLKTLGNRFSSLITLPEQIGFFYTEDFPVEQTVWDEQLGSDEARDLVLALANALAENVDRSLPTPADHFEQEIRTIADARQIKAGQLIHPCRVALTGQSRSAGIFDVMELIGCGRVIERLRRAAQS